MAAILLAFGGLGTSAARAQQEGPPDDHDLAHLDLASLMQIKLKVTTVSKSAQSIYDVAAPIYVITAEDMRRAGATSIPEALRLAPGVTVGQIDAGKWVVSMRGFAWEYANKALILLDGRAVYTPLNSSVYWNTLDVPIEEIDRIEVIRGPGDARWGSHAVNGIINIITRTAGDGRGTSASASVDTNSSELFNLSHGGAITPSLDYRGYLKFISQGDFALVGSPVRIGDRPALRAGVRLDGKSGDGDRLTFIGSLQRGHDASTFKGEDFAITRYDTNESSATARWERGEPGQLNQQAQLSFDRLNQELFEERNTFDFAWQTQLPEWRAQAWTFGATYKRSSDVLAQGISIDPARMIENTYGAFAHTSIALSDTSRLLVSSQLEHNVFTGWEVQPDVQFLHTPRAGRSYWASVSRAVRTPMRTENGFALDVPIFPGGFARIAGNRDLQAEDVLAWQAGARFGIRNDLFVDVATFYNQYQHLIIQVPGAPIFEPLPLPGRTIFPAIYANSASGHTKGVEVVFKARPVAPWNLSAGVTLYSQTPWTDPLGFGSVAAVEHQFQIQSALQVAKTLEWDGGLYYTGALTTGDVPSYYKLDTHLAWHPRNRVELTLGVRNALAPAHREAGVNAVNAVAEIPRSAYLGATWHFVR